MKKKQKSILNPFLLICVLILCGVCGWLFFINTSQKKQIKAQNQQIEEAREAADEWKQKAADLELENQELQTALEEMQAEEEVTEEEAAEPEKEEEPKKKKKQKSADLSNMETVETQTLVDPKQVDMDHLEKYFQSYAISDTLFDRIYGDDRSYKTYCTIPREDLSYIKVLHYDYNGDIRVGEIIVNVKLVDDILYIFRTLFENKYQIDKMILVEAYGADDDTSVNDNNTSCFNYRVATDATTLSNHATGCAVDINPVQNPYFRVHADGSYDWDNVDAELYWDRTNDPEGRHMITYNDLCYKLFMERGFSWGGDWANPIDYQHFEKPVY